jgi:hypothetical protein
MSSDTGEAEKIAWNLMFWAVTRPMGQDAMGEISRHIEDELERGGDLHTAFYLIAHSAQMLKRLAEARGISVEQQVNELIEENALLLLDFDTDNEGDDGDD